MNITKLDLCARVSKRMTKTPIADLKPIFENMLDEILQILSEGHRIEIRGFGCFKPVTKKERVGRNPRSGEKVVIPSYVTPCFKFSKDAQKIFLEKKKK